MQDGTAVVVGGKTNRAKLEFPEEMNRLLDGVPEIVDIDKLVNNLTMNLEPMDSSTPNKL